MAGALLALKCLSRAHTERFIIWPDSQFRIREKKKRVSHSQAPITGADLLGGLQKPPGSSPGWDSSVAPTTVCLFTETLGNRNEAPGLYRRK